MADDNNDYWSIKTKGLYDLVNDKRRLRHKSPIDHGTMQTRLSLKCGIVCPGAIDFSAEELSLETSMLPRLEAVLNELFDLYLENELKRYCKFHAAHSHTDPIEEAFIAPEIAAAEAMPSETAGGLGGLLRRLFRR